MSQGFWDAMDNRSGYFSCIRRHTVREGVECECCRAEQGLKEPIIKRRLENALKAPRNENEKKKGRRLVQ